MMRVRPQLVASLVLALWSCGCGPLFDKPRVSVRRVDITNVSFTGVSANVVFAVDNPNIIGIDLARLAYQLTVDGHAFVQGAGDHTLHVPANGTGELQLPISVRFVELAQSLAALFTKKQVPYTIATQLGFGTPLGVLDVPINHAGTLPVPQLPLLSLGPATVGNAGFSGATLSLTIDVLNPNPFPLPVGALRYALVINGVTLADAATPPQRLGAGATLPLVLSAHLDVARLGFGVMRIVEARAATVALDGSFDLVGYTMPVHLQTTLR
jgi:LEA14-like dessication related protein